MATLIITWNTTPFHLRTGNLEESFKMIPSHKLTALYILNVRTSKILKEPSKNPKKSGHVTYGDNNIGKISKEVTSKSSL